VSVLLLLWNFAALPRLSRSPPLHAHHGLVSHKPNLFAANFGLDDIKEQICVVDNEVDLRFIPDSYEVKVAVGGFNKLVVFVSVPLWFTKVCFSTLFRKAVNP